MNPYFAFSDECGDYAQIRNEKFTRSHPFYVRSTVMLSMDDYITLQAEMTSIKNEYSLSPQTEVKWSHYGSALKNNYRNIPHALTPRQLEEYYIKCLKLLCSLKSAVIYYTFTDNKAIKRVDKIKLIKMHLQNAYQKVQTEMVGKNGYAIFIIDDLKDNNKALKQAAYQMTLTGDYVQYTNIKKGLYIDSSDQCHGLQIADICAGVFTASLKYTSVSEDEHHKYQVGFSLLFNHIYKKIRYVSNCTPYADIHGYGIKEIPTGIGSELARNISQQVEKKLNNDIMQELHELFSQNQ